MVFRFLPLFSDLEYNLQFTILIQSINQSSDRNEGLSSQSKVIETSKQAINRSINQSNHRNEGLSSQSKVMETSKQAINQSINGRSTSVGNDLSAAKLIEMAKQCRAITLSAATFFRYLSFISFTLRKKYQIKF